MASKEENRSKRKISHLPALDTSNTKLGQCAGLIVALVVHFYFAFSLELAGIPTTLYVLFCA